MTLGGPVLMLFPMVCHVDPVNGLAKFVRTLFPIAVATKPPEPLVAK